MALLQRLAGCAPRPATRDELLETVWSDVVVADDALTTAVSKLRRAFASADPETDYVETVPKVGYRLVAPVGPVAGDAPTGLAGPAARDPAGVGPGGSEGDATERRGVPPSALLAASVLVGGLVLAGWLLWPEVPPRPGDEPRANPEWTPEGAPAGLRIRPVTSSPGLEVEPAFAPVGGGDRIAFSWKGPQSPEDSPEGSDQGSGGGNWDVWVQVPGGGEPLRLTTDPGSDHYPTWSPDGRSLAFARFAGGDCTLLRVPAQGGSEAEIGPCLDLTGMAWAPNGETLYLAERADATEPFRIVALRLAGLERRVLTAPDRGSVGDVGVAPSPDGATLAIRRSPVLGVEDVWLVPAVDWAADRIAGREARRLTHDALKIHGLDWAPDGRSLVYSSNRGGLFSLWRVPADGGEPTWLGASGGDLDAPSVGPDGRRIVYEQWQDEVNLYRLELEPDEPPAPTANPDAASGPVWAPELVAASTRWDFQPAVAPGGDRLAFVSDRSASAEIWVAPFGSRRGNAGTPEQRTSLGGPYTTSPRWDPTGRRLAFDARIGGNADVHVLDAEGARPRRLTTDPAEDVAPSWSLDGEAIYFGSSRGGAWRVWRTPAAGSGGEPRPVTPRGAYRAIERIDEAGRRWLYYSLRHQPGLFRVPSSPAANGPPSRDAAERVLGDLAPLDRANWDLRESTLVYVHRPTVHRPVLVRMDLETGEREEVGPLSEMPYNSGLALTPDGAAVLFARIDRHESDLMLLETRE
jgi:Tol biopolymer transport system component